MLSYHNDPAVKIKYQQRFEAHRRAEEVIQGTGFDNGRGCFVGCTLDAYAPDRFPEELGWPVWLAYLADAIFEQLPEKDAPQFGTDLLEAVQVGKDLEPVRWQLAALRLRKLLEELGDNENEYAEEVRKAITIAISYCESEIKPEEARVAAMSKATEARRMADEATWSGDPYVAAAAAEAAWAVGESMQSDVRGAAWAAKAASDSARSAWAQRQAYQWERDALLDLLRNM